MPLGGLQMKSKTLFSSWLYLTCKLSSDYVWNKVSLCQIDLKVLVMEDVVILIR